MAENFKDLIALEPAAPWDAGTGSNPYLTVSANRAEVNPTATGVDTKSPTNALQAMVDRIQNYGGANLHIYPGTAPYQFDGPVDFDGKPVTVIQHKGAIIQQANADACFNINTQVDWHGLYARYDVSTTSSGKCLFKLRSGTTTIACNVDGTANTFTRSSGSFVTDGYQIGDYIIGSGYSSAGNNDVYLVIGVAATVLTVRDTGGTLVTESGGAGVIARKDQFRGFRVHDGFVSLCPTNAAIPGYFVFDILGQDDTHACPGIDISNVTFEIRNWTLSGGLPTQQTNAWSGTEYTSTPHGLGFVKITNCRAFKIRGCDYRSHGSDIAGDSPVNSLTYGGVYLLQDSCLEGIVSDAVFSGVGLMAATGKEALPFMVFRTSTGNEGGHTIVHDIYTENCVGKHFAYSHTPWVTFQDVKMGRWFPKYTRSGIKLAPNPSNNKSRSNDVLGLTTHNVNGPENSGTFSTSSVTSKVTGTNVHLGIEVNDWVRLTNFHANVDGLYLVTAVGTNELTLHPTPITQAGDGNETVWMQHWAVEAERHNDALFGLGNHAFSRSSSPRYKLTDCSGIKINANEPIDGPQPFT